MWPLKRICRISVAKRFIFLTIGVVFIGWLSLWACRSFSSWYFRHRKEHYDNSVLFVSATFFDHTSKSLPVNSFAIIGVAPVNYLQTVVKRNVVYQEVIAFACQSSKGTREKYSLKTPIANLFMIGSAGECEWRGFLAICHAVGNATELKVIVEETLTVQVPIRKADKTSRDFVTCTYPLTRVDQWMLLLSHIEIMRHFGTDLQVFYFWSSLSEIYQILRAYDRIGVIKLIPFFRFESKHLFPAGWKKNPNSDSNYVYQMTTYTDCLYLYKDSAKFMSFLDMDDVIIPFGQSYKEDLEKLLGTHHLAAAFLFQRRQHHFSKEWNPLMFSFHAYMLHSVTASALVSVEQTKYVAIPGRTIIPGIHIPELVLYPFYRQAVAPEFGLVEHMSTGEHSKMPGNPKLHTFLTADALTEIDKTFLAFLANQSLTAIFNRLPAYSYYTDIQQKCHTYPAEMIRRGLCDHGPGKCQILLAHPNKTCANVRTTLTDRFAKNHGTVFVWRESKVKEFSKRVCVA